MPSSCQTAVTVNDFTSNITALRRGIALKNVRRFKELRPPSSRMSVHLNQDILARSFELTYQDLHVYNPQVQLQLSI